jgi:iron complex outermembrane recepter protein
MSELIKANDNRATIRWKLLTGASALALVASAYSASTAQAADSDADHPILWIELGGLMDKVGGEGEAFAPPFLAANPGSPELWNGVSPLQAQKPPKFAFDEEGKITFQPDNSDWSFSAGIRFGRSGNFRHVHHQTYNEFAMTYKYGAALGGQSGQAPLPSEMKATDAFADTHARRSETHAILDFQAGKDVGLGLFGGNASSTVSLGVRIAQFTSKQTFDIRARPEMHFKYHTFGSFGLPGLEWKLPYFHSYHATGKASRNFRGIGPSLAWSGSAPFAGNVQDGELTVDWVANAALLFGRQRARVHSFESAHYRTGNFPTGFGGERTFTAYAPRSGGHDNIRNVTVPNLGGSIGVSWRLHDFKISFGYRADFFFGAMDTGIDAIKKSNATFNGPYASVSVGLGD